MAVWCARAGRLRVRATASAAELGLWVTTIGRPVGGDAAAGRWGVVDGIAAAGFHVAGGGSRVELSYLRPACSM